jgi:hypothetical protein
LKTTWGSFETFWIPDEYQLSNVWRRIRDFAAWLRSGIARKIHYGAGLLDCHAVKYKGRHPQCPQNGGFVDILEHHFSKFKKNHSGYEVA